MTTVTQPGTGGAEGRVGRVTQPSIRQLITILVHKTRAVKCFVQGPQRSPGQGSHYSIPILLSSSSPLPSWVLALSSYSPLPSRERVPEERGRVRGSPTTEEVAYVSRFPLAAHGPFLRPLSPRSDLYFRPNDGSSPRAVISTGNFTDKRGMITGAIRPRLDP